MDKDLIISILAANSDFSRMIAESMGADPDALDSASYMMGASAAYSIVLESIENGDFDLEPEQQLLFG